MSDIMRPIPFAQLMDWALTEYRQQKSLFGVCKLVRHENGQARPIFGEKIEAPFGPAAGPNTQLAQNIVAAYAAGARFFELKTVQIMDGEALSKCVAKPCITAGDECYNCEWSTELTVPQAYEEYVKAWFACKLLAKELALGDPDGFVFNMSVGYDLEGIKSPKIDAYLEGMKDASGSAVWRTCMEWALDNTDRFEQVDAAYIRAVSPRVSCSITESTLHGCPPDEIERIATYLITEKGLHTYIKCNPTLLGYTFARKRLDSLGFDYVTFDDHHFAEDLQWTDAVPMFRRLMGLCAERKLEFGVKLTNTFPVDVAAGELPSQEMYMSGRALFPLTISLARRIAEEFEGGLRISYSGGADVHNVEALFAAGIWPITVATTILKPGGYQRLSQMGKLLMDCGSEPFRGVNAQAVAALAEQVESDPYYRKPIKPLPSRKSEKSVPWLDCFTAPCQGGCPIEQDIPAYLRLVGEGRYEEALRVITQRNPLPFITGTICSHRCQDKCMRGSYEESVYIRAKKLEAAQKNLDNCNAVAPISGQVIGLSVTPGQELQANSTLVTVSDTSTVTISATVDERNISYIKTGMSVNLDQWGTSAFGTVETVSLSSTVNNGVASYPITISADNTEGNLQVNSYVNYQIQASQNDNCLMVPIQAVRTVGLEDGSSATVVYVQADSRPDNALELPYQDEEIPSGFYPVQVEIGIQDTYNVEIKSGVNDGDTVFTQMITDQAWG